MMSTRRGRRLLALAAAVALACVGAAGTAGTTASAAPVYNIPEAVGYDYSPGEPAISGGSAGTVNGLSETACTGSFAIAGDSGFFLTTARMCGYKFDTMHDGTYRGDAGYYADTVNSRPAEPVVLLEMRPGNDAHQLLVDARTGESPAGGYVQGWMPTRDQSYGMLVGKMGIDTGWTEGRIVGIARWHYDPNIILICTDAPASGADGGGPVWRNDEYGLRALGTVLGVTDKGGACYRPIQETLYAYGARMPSFGPEQGRPTWGTFAPGMPLYDGYVQLYNNGRSMEKGADWRL